ncbi:hypothetical protein OAM01_02160 [bacterium]|nr:hypothetical protein [bacterium]
MLSSEALSLESKGQVKAAIANYEEVVQRFASTEEAMDAAASIRNLKAKIG